MSKPVNVEIAQEFERKYFIQYDAIGRNGNKITLEQVVQNYYDKQNCDIIGMTTTGAAKNHRLLSLLQVWPLIHFSIGDDIVHVTQTNHKGC